MIAELELRNEKQLWPSISLRVVGENKKQHRAGPDHAGLLSLCPAPRLRPAESRAATFRIAASTARMRSAIRTRFPFGFFEKTRRVDSDIEILVYPRVEPADQFYEILPLLSGEMASYFRGRGHELHSLRDYQPTDSARFVDWKATAKTGQLMVREFAREDERRVMLVLDPFIGTAAEDAGETAQLQLTERFERAVSLAASHRLAFLRNRLRRCNSAPTVSRRPWRRPAKSFMTRCASSRAFSPTRPRSAARSSTIWSAINEIFKIILTRRPQHTIPTRCGPRPTSSSSTPL